MVKPSDATYDPTTEPVTLTLEIGCVVFRVQLRPVMWASFPKLSIEYRLTEILPSVKLDRILFKLDDHVDVGIEILLCQEFCPSVQVKRSTDERIPE